MYCQIVKKKKQRYINSIVASLSQKRSIHGGVALKSRTFPLTGITEMYMSLTVNVLVEQSASQNSGHCLASSLIVNSFFRQASTGLMLKTPLLARSKNPSFTGQYGLSWSNGVKVNSRLWDCAKIGKRSFLYFH